MLDLQHVHKLTGIDVAGIEQEVMRGNRKQGLRKLTNTADEEVLDVLRCEDDGRILFTDTLGGVTDILDGRHVREEQIQLVDGCYRIAVRQEIVVHIGQDVEEHSILQLLIAVHESLDTEADKLIVGDVGVSVEELRFSTLAHGVDSETDFTEKLFGEERLGACFVLVELFLSQGIQVFHNRIVGILDLGEVGVVVDSEVVVQLRYEDLERIDVCVGEVLVGTEEVLEVGDVLTEHRGLAESFGGILVGDLVLIGPAFGLQGVDDILATHKVDIASTEVVAEIFILLLCIQGDERFTGLAERHEQELQKIGLTLSRVTEDEDIAVGLVIATAIEVNEDIGSVSVLADIEAVGIGLTGVVKRI